MTRSVFDLLVCANRLHLSGEPAADERASQIVEVRGFASVAGDDRVGIFDFSGASR